MDKLVKLFEGRKTYISAGLIGVFACLQALGIVVPEYVYAILGAFGFASLRSAVKK